MMTPSLNRLRHAGEKDLRPLFEFGLGQLLLARGDPPGVARGIGDDAAAVAPELIVDWHLHRGARVDGALERGIAILHVNPESRRRSAELPRTLAHHHVVGVEVRITDAELGMHDLAVGSGAAVDLHGAERLLVPVDRLCGVVERQLRSDGMQTLWNKARGLRHLKPPARWRRETARAKR